MRRPASISMLLAAVICLSMSFAGFARAGSEQDDNMIVNSGDTLDIRFPSVPQISKQYVVSDNGGLYFPVLDDVDMGVFYVAGPHKQCACTVKEIRTMLENKLGEFYQPDRARVEIDLMALNLRVEQTVYLLGEVFTPGAFRHFSGMKILDILVKGTRVTDKADLRLVRVSREGVNLPPMDISGILDGTDFSNNVEVLPGDIIVVPMKSVTELKITALGKVSGVGTFFLPVGSRVLDIFAKVGGGSGRAGVGDAYVIRMVDNKAAALRVDFKALVNRLDLAQNIELQDGDIFFVPESRGVDLSKILNGLTIVNFMKTMLNN